MTPETRYARRGDVHLAYQVLGEGPPDIVLLDQWFSHVDAQWEVGPLAAFRERLAAFGRLIMFDKSGSGLSDPVPTAQLPSIDEWIGDITAVLDAVGSQRAAVVANIGGGMFAVPFAVASPERVAQLILVDCFARFLADDDYPFGAPAAALDVALAESSEGTGRGVMLDLFAPSVADDRALRSAWSRYERQATSPGSAVATVRLIYTTDLRPLLGRIAAPTLVIHREQAVGFPVEHGRYLAEHIPGASFVGLPGVDNLIWAGDADAIAAEIEAFVTGVRPAREPHRVLATVLFTDLVDSTRRAAESGDQRWTGLLDEHLRVTRRQLARFGGREVKTVGDGILATFDAPARAIRCAAAIRDGVRELGLELRAGLHTGEIELGDKDIAGIAVHIAARVAGLAGPGQVLVSSTVRDLVAGSGFTFEDQGERELKGVPGTWRLHAALV